MNKIKILFVLLGILLGVNTMSAQKQQRQHLKFMGIPITGTISTFADKLKVKNPNWIEVERTDSVILFKGKFHLFENAKIEIKKSAFGEYVGTVAVFSLTPDDESRQSAIVLYCDLLKKYKKVEPSKIEEPNILIFKWVMKTGNVSWTVDTDMRGVRICYEDYAEVERRLKYEFERSERARQDL